MANAMVEQCLGKLCIISTGSMGTSYQGTVIEITDNWIRLENKGVVDLINCDYIQSIREIRPKKR